MSIRIRSLLVAVVLVAGGAAPAGAAVRTVRPAWRTFASGVAELFTAGDYVAESQGPPGQPVTVINDRTGKRRQITENNCAPVGIGLPWLLFSCNPSSPGFYSAAGLYELDTGQFSLTSPAPATGYCTPSCGGPPYGPYTTPWRVGRTWLEWREGFAAGPGKGVNKYVYQQITSGQVEQDPTSSTAVPDLDHRTLRRPVCRPVRVPQSYNDHAGGFGTLAFDGRFVLAHSFDPPIPGNLYTNDPAGETTYLERCGRPLDERIGNGAVANAHAVLWPAGGGPLVGLSLPALRWLLIQPPARSPQPLQVGLTALHLYLLDDQYHLWRAPAPCPPAPSAQPRKFAGCA